MQTKMSRRPHGWGARGGVLSICFLPDGRLVTAGRDSHARVWDAAGQQQAELPVTTVPATAVAASSDGARIVVGDYAGRLTIFRDGTLEGELSAAPQSLLERAIARQRGTLESLRVEGDVLANERAAVDRALGELTAREREFTDRLSALETELRALEERWTAERRAILARSGRVD